MGSLEYLESGIPVRIVDKLGRFDNSPPGKIEWIEENCFDFFFQKHAPSLHHSEFQSNGMLTRNMNVSPPHSL